jgi:hypothetical protein
MPAGVRRATNATTRIGNVAALAVLPPDGPDRLGRDLHRQTGLAPPHRPR